MHNGLRLVKLVAIGLTTNLFLVGSSVENVTAFVGQDQSLECKVTASTDVSVDWLVKRLESSDFTRFVYRGRLNEDLTDKYTLQRTGSVFNLTIRNLAISDSGTYVCSWGDHDESTFSLTVRNKSTTTPASETPTLSTTVQANGAGIATLY